MILPFGILFCGGVFLTVCQSLGLFTPLPYTGGLLDAYAVILSDPSFFASAGFSLGVALTSAAGSVAAGTFLAWRVWKLPKALAGAALVYKIPLILPHIAVAFVVLVFWSRSGILASLAYHLGLIHTLHDFPNVLYAGWGMGMILALFSYPYMFRALVAGFQTMGEDFRICARNLGAGPVTLFWQVELPLLVPAIIAGGSVVFLVAFSEYFLVFLMGGGTVPSFTGYLMPLLASSNRSLAAILTLIFLLLPILLFFVLDVSLMRSYRKKGMA